MTTLPGYCVRFPRANLDSYVAVLTAWSSKFASKLPVSDFTFRVGHTDATFTDIYIAEFVLSAYTYSVQAPDQVSATLTFATLAFTGRFETKEEEFWLWWAGHKLDEGEFTLSFNNVQVTTSTTILVTEDGALTCAPFDSQATLGTGQLTLMRSIHQDPNPHTDQLFAEGAALINSNFSEFMAFAMNKSLRKPLRRYLSRFPARPPVIDGKSLNGELTLAITQDYLEVSCREGAWDGYVEPWPAVAFNMNVAGNPDAIVSASDILFDKLIQLAHAGGSFDFTVSPSSPPALYGYISLACTEPGACLGSLDPQLPAYYGADALVELHMQASAAPTLEFKPGDAAVTASWNATLTITQNQAGAQPEVVATGTVSISGSLTASAAGHRIYAQLSIATIQLQLDQPNLESWETSAKDLFRDIVHTRVNNFFLTKGLVLPGLVVDGTTIVALDHQVRAKASWSRPVS